LVAVVGGVGGAFTLIFVFVFEFNALSKVGFIGVGVMVTDDVVVVDIFESGIEETDAIIYCMYDF
jgi:hypothetical protein